MSLHVPFARSQSKGNDFNAFHPWFDKLTTNGLSSYLWDSPLDLAPIPDQRRARRPIQPRRLTVSDHAARMSTVPWPAACTTGHAPHQTA